MVRSRYQNIPGKIAKVFPAAAAPTESGAEVDRRPGGMTTSPTLLDPVLVWSHKYYSRLWKAVKCFTSFYACFPRHPSQSKTRYENELNECTETLTVADRRQCQRNKAFRSGRFGLGRFGLAVSVWGRFGHDISVHKQLITFVYLNDYRQAKCHSSWCCTKSLWGVMIAMKSCM